MRTSRRAALALALFALSALAQDVPIILSNFGLLHDWATEGFASTAYTSEWRAHCCQTAHRAYSQRLAPADTGCDGRAAPQTINGSVFGLAVRVNLPAIGIYHTCEPEPSFSSAGPPGHALLHPLQALVHLKDRRAIEALVCCYNPKLV